MPDVPDDVLDRLRPICLGLPETYEEAAWIGRRWRVRTRTFAHVYAVADSSSSVLRRVADAGGDIAGDVTAVTFRAPAEELAALQQAGPPFFHAEWGRDVIGLVLGAGTDWDEVGELLTDSFCTLAPRKLVARVARPLDPTD